MVTLLPYPRVFGSKSLGWVAATLSSPFILMWCKGFFSFYKRRVLKKCASRMINSDVKLAQDRKQIHRRGLFRHRIRCSISRNCGEVLLSW